MKSFLVLFVLILLFAACTKTVEQLPEPTQTGANTFGAKVNGENWGPLKAGVLPASNLLEARYSGNNSIVINARNFSRAPIETEMEIYIQNVTAPGVFLLNQDTERYPYQSANYALYEKRNITIEDEWKTSSTATGQVTVTRIDTINHIVAGTFSFNTQPRYGGTPVTVTDGRFDIRIQ